MWLVLSLFGALLFASTTFFDKFLLSNVTRHFSASAYVVLSGIAGVPFMLMLYALARHSIGSYSIANMLSALAAGLLLVSGYYLYFRSLTIADASLVAVLFQLAVVSNLILGWILLDEHLSPISLTGLFLVLLGTVSVNLEVRKGALFFEKRVFLLMCIAAVLVSCSDILFKHTALESNYLATQFYAYCALSLTAAGVFICSHTPRQQFLNFVRKKHKPTLLAFFNELTNVGGIMAVSYALLLAPVALVQATVGFEAVYAVLIGTMITKFFPKLMKENSGKRHIALRYASVAIVVIGTAMLAFSTGT